MATGVWLGGEINRSNLMKLASKPKYLDNPGALAKKYYEAAYSGTFNIGTTKKDQSQIADVLTHLASQHGISGNPTVQKLISDLRSNNYTSDDMKYLANRAEDAFNNAVAVSKSSDDKNGLSTGGGSSSGSGGSGGGGSSYVAPVEELKKYTADELAKRFGIVNDYATILKEMQDATTAKFDETETTMKRAESTNLRAQESAYNQYLQDLRSRSANAVASGATKGTMAANALTSLLGFQDSNRESANLMNDLLYDTAQQRGTFLKEDAVEARQRANEIGQYLGNLSTSMDTNAINKYAAELAAEAQTRAASIGAGATTSAARMSANSAYEQILNAFYNDYRNKGYSAQQANALKYTDYAGLIKNQYSPTK